MIIYGHRGSKGTIIENSLKGFTHNLAAGIKRFELDIQLTADKQLVVFHDTNLKRLTGIDKAINTLTLAELEQIKLLGSEESIPSLKRIIEHCPSAEHWQFEIKTHHADPGFIAPIKALIKQHNLLTKLVITSKHKGILRAFKKTLPLVKTGLVQEWPIPYSHKAAYKLQCDFLCINKNLASARYVKKAQALGLHVSVWTVNNLDDMKKLQSIGVNSVISDYPLSCQHLYQSINPN